MNLRWKLENMIKGDSRKHSPFLNDNKSRIHRLAQNNFKTNNELRDKDKSMLEKSMVSTNENVSQASIATHNNMKVPRYKLDRP